MIKLYTFSEYKNELSLVSALFFVSVLAGILTSTNPPDLILVALDSLTELAESLINGSPRDIFIAIFINNLVAIITTIIGGLMLGIGPIISSIVNGYVIGVVSGLTILDGQGLLLAIGIVPHGIIEIPVLLISLALGLRLGRLVWTTIRNSSINSSQTLYQRLRGSLTIVTSEIKRSLYFAWRILLPGIFLAAIIESTITPYLIGLI